MLPFNHCALSPELAPSRRNRGEKACEQESEQNWEMWLLIFQTLTSRVTPRLWPPLILALSDKAPAALL